MDSLRETIREAGERGIALGHFNISNLEQLKAIAAAAMKLDLPVIIGVSEGERGYLGLHHVRDLMASYNAEHARERGFRLYLNADHTHSLEQVREAARVGFHAVLFDGGRLLLEENIRETQKAVALAKSMSRHVLVEGELGYIGGSSEVLQELPAGAAIRPEDLTKPEDAARFVREAGVDLLAPAVGNIHGMFANAPNPRLDIERIRAIKRAAKVPLVLHGGSGISDEDFRAAIEAGIAIIHISTELRVAWRKGLERVLREHPSEVAPYKLMGTVVEEMGRIVENRLRLFSRI